jgi:DNA-binding transcriptional MerR regulator
MQNYNYFRDLKIKIVKMIDPKTLTKLYYTIGEVADMFDVNTSLIRFWEKEFGFIQPKKNKKGNRIFTPKDIVNFNKIYQLVKTNGYTLEGAKRALKTTNITKEKTNEAANEVSSNDELIARLEAIKQRLISLKS